MKTLLDLDLKQLNILTTRASVQGFDNVEDFIMDMVKDDLNSYRSIGRVTEADIVNIENAIAGLVPENLYKELGIGRGAPIKFENLYAVARILNKDLMKWESINRVNRKELSKRVAANPNIPWGLLNLPGNTTAFAYKKVAIAKPVTHTQGDKDANS